MPSNDTTTKPRRAARPYVPRSNGGLRSTRPRKARGSGITPGRSLRIPDGPWEAAKERAAQEGFNTSHLVTELMRAYGAKMIDLPRGTETLLTRKNVGKQDAA